MKNYKISVHISYFLNNNKKKKLFNQVCINYLKLSKNTKIFVHTNKLINSTHKRIKFITYKIKNEHPYKLTWKYRELMFKQKNNYDFFIYGEDDVIFSKKNLKYWIKYKDICVNNNYNLGFLRVDKRKKNNFLYSTDQIKKIKYFLDIRGQKFVKLENPYSAFWIYSKNEFKKFTKTKYWSFNWSWKTVSGVLLTREMAAIGWHGKNMSRYKATIVPLEKKKLHQGSFIKHASNNYANSPAGLFGTIKVNDLLLKKLIKFQKSNLIHKLIIRFISALYHLFRFNLKKIKKLLGLSFNKFID